jgi:hypothetical protein
VQGCPEVNRLGTGSKLPHGQQAGISGLLDRTAQLILINGAAGHVNKRAQNRGGPESRMRDDIFCR